VGLAAAARRLANAASTAGIVFSPGARNAYASKSNSADPCDKRRRRDGEGERGRGSTLGSASSAPGSGHGFDLIWHEEDDGEGGGEGFGEVDQGDAADGEREREVKRGPRVGYRFAERLGQAFLNTEYS
jgi:hypothetical protein